MTQQINGSHDIGHRCEWPVGYSDPTRQFVVCGQLALFLVKIPADVYLCEEHYQSYLKMIGKKEDYD